LFRLQALMFLIKVTKDLLSYYKFQLKQKCQFRIYFIKNFLSVERQNQNPVFSLLSSKIKLTWNINCLLYSN